MPHARSENLSALRRWADHLRGRVGVRAVQAGQDVIEAGLRQRCPVRARRQILPTIRATAVGSNHEFIGAFVVVASPRAVFVEARSPFIEPTYRQDGPRAARAMAHALKSGL